MCTTGRAAQGVAGLTFWVKHAWAKNIKTCMHLLVPCSGQLPFLGLRLAVLTGYLVEKVHLNLLAAPDDFRQLGYHQPEASNPDEVCAESWLRLLCGPPR